jgi:iron-sulfur cluster repair protein YtfE (RIC family)
MLISLGKPRIPDGLVDLLMECHERIHRFLDMASRLTEAREAEPEEVQTAAGQVRRYFADALPQHIDDEDVVIAPYLTGRTSALEAALGTMSADHIDHTHAVSRLVIAAGRIEKEPHRLASARHEFAAASADLRALLVPHLALEEDVVFPALHELSTNDQHAIRAAMRERRLSALVRGGRYP